MSLILSWGMENNIELSSKLSFIIISNWNCTNTNSEILSSDCQLQCVKSRVSPLLGNFNSELRIVVILFSWKPYQAGWWPHALWHSALCLKVIISLAAPATRGFYRRWSQLEIIIVSDHMHIINDNIKPWWEHFPSNYKENDRAAPPQCWRWGPCTVLQSAAVLQCCSAPDNKNDAIYIFCFYPVVS